MGIVVFFPTSCSWNEVYILCQLLVSSRVLIFLGYMLWLARFFTSSREVKLYLVYIWCFIFRPVDLRLGCFFTSSRGLYDLVSVVAYYFDPRLMFIGQGMYMFLRPYLFGLPGYRTNTRIRVRMGINDEPACLLLLIDCIKSREEAVAISFMQK